MSKNNQIQKNSPRKTTTKKFIEPKVEDEKGIESVTDHTRQRIWHTTAFAHRGTPYKGRMFAFLKPAPAPLILLKNYFS